MDTIFKFLHSKMFTLALQISKLTKAVVVPFRTDDSGSLYTKKMLGVLD